MLLLRAAFLPLAAVVVAFAADTSTPLAKDSPFIPRGNGAPVIAANETLEFTGVSAVIGKKPDLIFRDKNLKKNYWITEGETSDGISVLKYDSRREMVVVKTNGVEKTLALRKGTGAVNAPTPQPVAPMPGGFNTPAPIATTAAAPGETNVNSSTVANAAAPAPTATPAKPEGPPTPETQARQETEARMLVSDLLEIGMAQRKAYEEAQRRATQTNNPAQPAPADPNQPPASSDSQPAAKPNGN